MLLREMDSGAELVQEGKKETFPAIPLGKLNNAWTYAKHPLFLIILVGYCSGKHRVNYDTIGA